MKNGNKNGSRSKKPDGLDDPEIAAALGKGRPEGGDPFADFLEDFHADPQKPLKFLRSFMAGEDSYNPAVDVVEDKDRLTVVVDLPGVAEKDMQVEFVDGGLVIRGRREPAPESTGSRLRRAERPAGDFVKSIPLPRGLNPEAVVPRLENGVLTLLIPKGASNRNSKSLKAGNP